MKVCNVSEYSAVRVARARAFGAASRGAHVPTTITGKSEHAAQRNFITSYQHLLITIS